MRQRSCKLPIALYSRCSSRRCSSPSARGMRRKRVSSSSPFKHLAHEPKNTIKKIKKGIQKQRLKTKIHTLGGYPRMARIHTNISDHILILRLLGEQEGAGRTTSVIKTTETKVAKNTLKNVVKSVVKKRGEKRRENHW